MAMSPNLGLPSTFEQRGCLVGFHKQGIAQARLRARSDGREIEWEIVIPTNRDKRGGAVLIMPWRQLMHYTSLGERDRAVYDAIDAAEEDEPDPLMLRGHRLKVDAERHPTDEGRAAAKQGLLRDRADRLNVYISFLAQMTRAAGIAMGDTFMARADTALLMRLTQGNRSELDIDPELLTSKVMAFHANLLGVTPKSVNDRLAEIADMTAPFGTLNLKDDAVRDGYFNRTKARILEFESSLMDFEQKAFEDMRNVAMMTRFAAKDFVKFIEEKTGTIEQIFSNFATIFRESKRVTDIVNRARRDVSFALDGWDGLADLWFDALARGAEYPEKCEVLAYIFSHLPMMPEAEIDNKTERGKVWKGFNAARVSAVRAMVSWGDNAVDTELAERVARAKEAERAAREAPLSRGRRRR